MKNVLKQENKFFHEVKNHLIKHFNPGSPRSLLRGAERCGRFYTHLLREIVPTAFASLRGGRNLNKVITILLTLNLFISLVPAAAAVQDVSVELNGRRVVFAGQQPVIIGGRTLVPVRGVFEALGFDVSWNYKTRTAILENENYLILIPIDSYVFTTNGEDIALDVPAQLIGGRTMLPIRLPLESIGFDVGWNDESRTVSVWTTEVEIEDINELSICLETVTNLFSAVQDIWDEDDGDLWGFHLQTPLMFADPVTRHAVANMPAPNGGMIRHGDVYVGILPSNVFISDTVVSFWFSGFEWGMITWDAEILDFLPQYIDEMLRFVIRDAFQVLQPKRVVVRGDRPDNVDRRLSHLNFSADARIMALLEINALAEAVRAEGNERVRAISDALSIRAERKAQTPEAFISENLLEILYGLATFTEILVFGDAEAFIDFYLPWLIQSAESTDFNFFFPEFTGAMYALLLRETGANWQRGITFETDLALLLREALGIEYLTPFDQVDIERYGYTGIAPGQRAFVREFERIRQGAEIFLTGPRLLFSDALFVGATRLEIFHVHDKYGAEFTVFYGDFIYGSWNWRLEISGGYAARALEPAAMHVMPGLYVKFYEEIEVDEAGLRAVAPTWTLEITDENYKITITDDGEIEIAGR